MAFPTQRHFEQQIAKELPTALRRLPFRVDMALLDPRPDPKDRRAIPSMCTIPERVRFQPSRWKNS